MPQQSRQQSDQLPLSALACPQFQVPVHHGQAVKPIDCRCLRQAYVHIVDRVHVQHR